MTNLSQKFKKNGGISNKQDNKKRKEKENISQKRRRKRQKETKKQNNRISEDKSIQVEIVFIQLKERKSTNTICL